MQLVFVYLEIPGYGLFCKIIIPGLIIVTINITPVVYPGLVIPFKVSSYKVWKDANPGINTSLAEVTLYLIKPFIC